jgi:hypothetical protein
MPATTHEAARFGGNITQVGVEGFAWYRHEAMDAARPEPQS